MSARHHVGLLAVLTGVGGALAAAACTEPGGPAGATSTVSGSGGGAGSISYGGGLAAGGSSAVSCPWLEAETADFESMPSIQTWCEKGAVNPTDCPADEPASGTACPSAGLRCGYPANGGFSLATCDQHWSVANHACSFACELDGGVPVEPTPECGALPDIPCATDRVATDFERANDRFLHLTECCPVSEATVAIALENGCLVALAGPPDFVACYRALVAGRRLACARNVACLEATFSTLP